MQPPTHSLVTTSQKPTNKTMKDYALATQFCVDTIINDLQTCLLHKQIGEIFCALAVCIGLTDKHTVSSI